jgi:carbamoylphosphate synthase small subunit
LIKHAKINHPNENLSFDKLCEPYESSENKQGLNAELKKTQIVGIQGIRRKKKCQLVKKNGNLSISERENETLPFDKLCQRYESSENKQSSNAELKQAEKFGIQGIGRRKKCELVKKNGNLSISEKEDSKSNLQKLRTNIEIRKDLKNQHEVKCKSEKVKTFRKPKKNLVSPNLNLKKWKNDCSQLLNEMVGLPISEPFREPVSKIDFPNYYRLFFN